MALADDLISGARAAAEYTGLSERTIYHLVYKQGLPAQRRGGKIFFRKSELERYFSTEAA